MSPILAIASIAIRSAIRSRVVLALFLLLLIIQLAFPSTLRGDGTWEGYLQVLLHYTLGFSFWIIALAGMWAGCAAISHDIDAKTLQLVVVKPVNRLQIWLGKWIGLSLISATLMTLSMLLTVALLTLRPPPDLDPSHADLNLRDRLIARSVIEPPRPDVLAEARRILDTQIQQGQIPPEVHPNDALRGIIQNLQLQRLAVPPGQTLRWTLDLPAPHRPDLPLRLAYRFALSTIEPQPIPGRWLIRTPDGTPLLDLQTSAMPSVLNELQLDPRPLLGHPTLVIEYINLNQDGITVVFMPADGFRLLVPAGTFTANALRALLILLAQLLFLVAFGVTAGSLFSFPVAAFLSLYILLLIQSAGYIEAMAQTQLPLPFTGEAAPTLLHFLASLVYKIIHLTLHPLLMTSPLAPLATGYLIPWTTTATTLLTKVLLYSGALALLSTAVLNRREIALPST